MSAAKYFLGWIREHDRERFEIYAYHAGKKTDSTTEEVRRESRHFDLAVHEPGRSVLVIENKPSPAVRALLAPARLDVPVQKMRFQHAARELTRDLQAQIKSRKLTVRADVTRATGLVEAFTTGYPRLGWQLQGDVFRLCAEPDPRLAQTTRGWGTIGV